MISCIEREGTKACSWWWNGSCHNLHVPLNVRELNATILHAGMVEQVAIQKSQKKANTITH